MLAGQRQRVNISEAPRREEKLRVTWCRTFHYNPKEGDIIGNISRTEIKGEHQADVEKEKLVKKENTRKGQI